MKKHKPKIFIILSRFPYPLEKGDKLRAYNHIVRLAKNYNIILCCLSDKKVSKEEINKIRPYCFDLEIIRISKIRAALGVVRGLFFSEKPIQVNYFYHNFAQKRVDALIEKHLPKFFYCQLIRTTEYVKKYSIFNKVLDYMDTLSIGMERRAKNAKWYNKHIYTIEAKRLKNYEYHIFSFFEHKVIISEQDKQLIKVPNNSEIKVIPNGVDTSFFKPLLKEKKYDIVFTGNMNYAPNVEAAIFLVNRIMPIVWKENSNVKVAISGANPHSRVKALKSKNVIVTGWVNDIRNAYAESSIFIAPMQLGTGLQNKLLEAMAMKLPCITSKLANNALGATHLKNILIGETAQDFANYVLELLNNKQLAQEIAERGHQFVLENYNWDATTKKMEELIFTV